MLFIFFFLPEFSACKLQKTEAVNACWEPSPQYLVQPITQGPSPHATIPNFCKCHTASLQPFTPPLNITLSDETKINKTEGISQFLLELFNSDWSPSWFSWVCVILGGWLRVHGAEVMYANITEMTEESVKAHTHAAVCTLPCCLWSGGLLDDSNLAGRDTQHSLDAA